MTPKSLIDRGPPPAPPARFNIAAYVTCSAAITPDKPALEVIADLTAEPQIWTYAQIEVAIRGTMTGLRAAGLSAGDRLLLRLGNSIDFPLLFFAACGIGALPIPTSPQLTAPELARITALTTPRLAVASSAKSAAALPADLDTHLPGGFRPWRTLPSAAFAQTAAEDPAYIVFTSGTGGTPRAVVHAHRAAHARRMMWEDWYGLTPHDRLFHAGAFNWTYTLGTGLTDPWAAGATALIYTGPADRSAFARIIADHRPTIFAAAPGVYRQILQTAPARDSFATLRHGLSAGDALPAPLRTRWEAATGTPLLEALGMSEISTYVSEAPARPGLRPQRGRRIAVLDPGGAAAPIDTPGEIAVATTDPGLMLGYLTDAAPQLPQDGGWFRTGDIGQIGVTGTLTHLGRQGDLMNAQGYRVSAREVEEALLLHEAVAEAAVTAVPVRADVEVIGAFVVLQPHTTVTEEALAQHCTRHLARYKCPRVLRVLDALPRTGTGKVLKRRLKDHLSPEPPA